MPFELHVTGRITLGRFADFLEAVELYRAFRREHGYVVPRAWHALAGEMNSVRLIYPYRELAELQAEEERLAGDREYARVAGEMPFVDGTLRYELYRETAG